MNSIPSLASVPIPFLSYSMSRPIEVRIEGLLTNASLRLPDVKEELRSVLSDIHDLNKNQVIPYSWYREDDFGSASLEKVIKNLSIYATGQEYRELVSLLITYYFCGTNWLLFFVLMEAEEGYPELSEYITHIRMDSRNELRTPCLTSLGIDRLVSDLIEEKQARHVIFPGVFYYEELKEKLEDFYSSEFPRAIFLVSFNCRLCGHFSPLIVERDCTGLKILTSDSVLRNEVDLFTVSLVKQIKELSCPKRIYIGMEPRQTDVYSCSIFSIHDVKEAIKIWGQGDSATFFDQFKSQVLAEEGIIKEEVIQELPILSGGMMKMTQSLTKVRSLENLILQSKGRILSLKEYVDTKSYYCRNLLSETEAKRNLTSSIKLAKHFQYFLNKVISLYTHRVTRIGIF